ncbi:four helix bundle protein [Larkinella ripae]
MQGKAFAFGVRTVNLYKWLIDTKVPYKIAEQLLRSGSSIGANVEEAAGGYSRKDFAAKMGIASKEARETRYWLRLLQATNYLNERLATSMLDDCEALLKILSSILLTAQENSGLVREDDPGYLTLNS